MIILVRGSVLPVSVCVELLELSASNIWPDQKGQLNFDSRNEVVHTKIPKDSEIFFPVISQNQ